MNVSTPSVSRASSGVSRLALIQARFQAKQLAEKENKLIHLLEERQEAAVRRITSSSYNNVNGRESSNSANSLTSSNSSNSITASLGQRPAQMHQQQMFRKPPPPPNNNKISSPVGWDKSYPLKPVDLPPQHPDVATSRRPLYKRNANAAANVNKYSGNYGPKSRGVSLDRNAARGRYYPNNNTINNNNLNNNGITRTQSQLHLSHSSGEDSSYGSSSRPSSRSNRETAYATFARHNSEAAMNYTGRAGLMLQHLRNGNFLQQQQQQPSQQQEQESNLISPPRGRRSSYTQDYVRNLPPSSTSVSTRSRSRQPRLRDPSPGRNFAPEPGSFSSSSQSSSEKFEAPAFTVIKPAAPAAAAHHPRQLISDHPDQLCQNEDAFTYESKPTINTRTLRKQNRNSRSVSHSPDNIPRIVKEDLANNNNGHHRALKDKEDEQRRLFEAEMRKREEELLMKIKEQQKELESVKQEKTKVERELIQQRKSEERAPPPPPRQQPPQPQQQPRTTNYAAPLDRRVPRRTVVTLNRNSSRGSNDRLHLPDEETTTTSIGRSRHNSTSQQDEAARTNRNGASHKLPPPSRRTPQREIEPAKGRNSKSKSMTSSTTTRESSSSQPPPMARRSLFQPKPRDDLEQCLNCGRNFATDRIEKHTQICIKTSKKKRKTFDMTKKRTQGTEAEIYIKKGKHKQDPKSVKKQDWRKKREEFINALRAAKAAQRHLAAGGKISDLPPPPPMDTSDYIQCPHCGRKFNESAAERHIPKCKDIKSNKRR